MGLFNEGIGGRHGDTFSHPSPLVKDFCWCCVCSVVGDTAAAAVDGEQHCAFKEQWQQEHSTHQMSGTGRDCQ